MATLANTKDSERQAASSERVRRSPMRWLVLGLLLLSAGAIAQLAPQAPQPAYEGQNVSAVSLIANPHRNLDPLRPLVTQKVGGPYSESKVEASAKALQQAGGFAKVDVNVEPGIAGLRVNFLL